MLELDIQSLAYGGDAVGRLPDGRVAFVKGGCPGDRVMLANLDDRGSYVRADVAEIIEASPHRVTPPCPYFPACGGCSWQHIDYETQLHAKRAMVVDAIQRIGGLADAESIVLDAVPSPKQYGYRNKVELVADSGSDRLRLGFHEARSDRIVPVDSCLLLPKKVRAAPKALGGALRYLGGQTGLGLVRAGIRAADRTNDVEVAIWTEPGPFGRSAAARVLGQAIPTSSIVRVLTKGPPAKRAVAGVEVLSGRGHWREQLSNTQYAISAPSFFQVNTGAAEHLVHHVLASAAPDGSDRVLDLYAGAGTFTVPLAALGGEVVAVESAGSAVRDLRRNLERAALWADVVGGDAAREIRGLGRFDSVVVDPPRSGLAAEVIEAMAAHVPRTVVYVSCDPATLARDAAALTASGLRLESVVPIDLFPQSFHIEAVATFRSL